MKRRRNQVATFKSITPYRDHNTLSCNIVHTITLFATG